MKMCGNGNIDCVCGPYSVFPEGPIYRFDDGVAPKLPFAANIHNWFSRLACAMKRNDKLGLGQHILERRLIEISTRNMQGFLIAIPEKASELIPRPTTYVRYRPHDFRRAGLDATTVRSYQETTFDLAIAERDTEIPTENVSTLQNLCVTARLSQEAKDSTSNETRAGERPGVETSGKAESLVPLAGYRYCSITDRKTFETPPS
jgi:hypothetical protein